MGFRFLGGLGFRVWGLRRPGILELKEKGWGFGLWGLRVRGEACRWIRAKGAVSPTSGQQGQGFVKGLRPFRAQGLGLRV